MSEQVPGMLGRTALSTLVTNGDIDTVLVAIPDLYGRLVGKRYDAHYFLEAAEQGLHFCDYLLACDMEMDPVPGYQFTSWEQGYKDAWGQVDWRTLRRASWLEKSALVLCDVRDEHTKALVSVAPRSILQQQIERAQEVGLLAKGAVELEFFVFDETYDSAREKHYHDLKTFGSYIEDYHLFQGTKVEGLLGAMRAHLRQSGIPVEFSKGEWGAGQGEINIRYSDLLTMCDRTVIFKQLAKEIAYQQGRALTFMAKWHADYAGNSAHLHFSLWDDNGARNMFAGTGEPSEGLPVAASDTFRWAVGGILAHARALTLCFAPTVNSYKRYQAASFAPVAITWAYDNRTVGFRVVGEGQSLRVECRIPGADANPYLAFAALLAAALDGIAQHTEPPPVFNGKEYLVGDLPRVPGTIREAITEFEQSTLVRDVFGEEVVAHYLHFARTEQRKFDAAVTSWERARFFERV
ncbi:MAG: glutamine synthetase family protein [Anaerolineae bacterium]|nr:glutamine synthetase family protein [Anaerolineae bacterium]